MKWKLTEMQGRYQAHTGERLTYEILTAATGLSSATIASLIAGKTQNASLHTIEKLLAFFAARLGEDLTTNDLLEYRP